MNEKFILGIETSCDDTSVALVDINGNVKIHVKESQDDLLNEYGGVYPEFASRAHVTSIIPVIDKVLIDSQISIEDDIAAIAVTRGPGLIGSLLIGTTTANMLGRLWGKKVIGINHLRGHLKSVELENEIIRYPAIVLLVSGGHSFICHINKLNYVTMIGQTRDDSLGEAYDKLGRMLNYKFPAGPKIDNKAKLGQPNIKFPSPLYKKGFDFSFSGLKSSVSRYLENNESYSDIDICASFVESVLKVLDDKIRRSIEVHSDTKSLVIVGGVAASKQVRDLGLKISNDFNIELKLPSIKWATDNGAMIAMAGWDYLNKEAFIKAEPLARIPINEY